jgi:preprotein translocase subunit SecA
MDIIIRLFGKIFGTRNERLLKHYYNRVAQINALEPEISALSDGELKEKTSEFKKRLSEGQTLDDILPEAFAVVREASKRVLGMRHFDVQLIGGMVLHDGKIAEMRTGEGKTLVSTLPVYLNALLGKGVHVVTVNDYLAKRDSEWMGKIHRFLGVTVGCIECEPKSQEKFDAYRADITYGTNNEFGFDYLRDNLSMDKKDLMQRRPYYAVVDEVDSILIDEARTPLIISGPSDDKTELYHQLNLLVLKLNAEHYDLDEEHKAISLNDKGYDIAEELLRTENLLPEGESLYDSHNILITHHLLQALKAHKLFFKNKDYIVKNDTVMLIDEFSGRIMDGRRLSDGLHQAIEAKENVTIQPENQTLLSVTFQNYFRLYEKLSGMTGTAQTEATEFKESFNLEIVEIPTNNPVLRIDEEDVLFISVNKKYEAIVAKIKEAQANGQPILVGTASIERSEELSRYLTKENITHQILNARYHEQEANIVAQAGRFGAVTISTNMAGRGTDIQLGGSAEMRIKNEVSADLSEDERTLAIAKIHAEVEAEKQKVIQAGGLLVIGTERHDSRRIDNQLRGRSGRQGDPGRSIFYLSFEDDLLRIFGGDKLRNLFQKMGLEEDQTLRHKMLSNTIIRTQKKVEQRNYDARRSLMKFDDIMNEQRSVVFELRRSLLENENYQETILEMIKNYILEILPEFCDEKTIVDEWDIAGLQEHLINNLGHHNYDIETYLKNDGINFHKFSNYLIDTLSKIYQDRISKWSDGISLMIHREVVLKPLDHYWREHLNLINHLSKIINFRGYGQKDPLIEFKKESFESFSHFLSHKRQDTLRRIFRVEIEMSNEDADLILSQQSDNFQETTQNPQEFILPKILIHPETGQEVSFFDYPRNSLCPCGSGQKFKYCHGNPNEFTRLMAI